MRKGIDPPHIVALTIVVCAAIAPAFMLWGRTIGEWAVGIAVYTLITAVVLSLLVLDFVILTSPHRFAVRVPPPSGVGRTSKSGFATTG